MTHDTADHARRLWTKLRVWETLGGEDAREPHARGGIRLAKGEHSVWFDMYAPAIVYLSDDQPPSRCEDGILIVDRDKPLVLGRGAGVEVPIVLVTLGGLESVCTATTLAGGVLLSDLLGMPMQWCGRTVTIGDHARAGHADPNAERLARLRASWLHAQDAARAALAAGRTGGEHDRHD